MNIALDSTFCYHANSIATLTFRLHLHFNVFRKIKKNYTSGKMIRMAIINRLLTVNNADTHEYIKGSLVPPERVVA